MECHWGKTPGISFPLWYFEAEVLQAFFPPPCQNADQKRHNFLCPVRALDAYVDITALWRKNEQLFVCFGPPNKGSPASKQRMSKRVVEAISLAYESAGQLSPMAVRPPRP